MPFPKKVFKAYDIRGLLEEITPELAEAVAAALIRLTGSKKVVVGRDMRETSPALADATIQALTERGVNVVDIGLCSTPLFYYACTFLEGVKGGLMITASHNPAEYNGIKLMNAEGMPMSGEEIYEEIHQPPSPPIAGGNRSVGSVEKREVLEAYLDKVVASIDLPDVSGVKLAIDYGNGMGALTVQPLLKRLGVTPTELYPEFDARFPNHQADPVQPKNLVDLQQLMKTEQFDLGVATDGDADRIGFLDADGNYVRGDLVTALFAREVLKKHPGSAIAVAPNQSWAVFDTIEQAGGKAISTRIGHTNVSLGMKASGAKLGGEISSHFFFEEFGYLESPDLALITLLKMLTESEASFADLMEEFRAYQNSGEVNLEIEDKAAALAALEEKYTPVATKVDKLDGIRCEFEKDWWFIVRPSNTEPLLRVTVEAKTKELMDEKVDELVSFIHSL